MYSVVNVFNASLSLFPHILKNIYNVHKSYAQASH